MTKSFFDAPNHDPQCTKPHVLLRAAFLQKGYGIVPDTWFWHVLSKNKAGQTTLSMQGLKEWGIL